MKHPIRTIAAAIAAASFMLTSLSALAHGDVVPHSVETVGLAPLGEAWREANPFRSNDIASKIGSSAFGQNCARCHGLDAISGGIAPDLRKLDRDCVDIKNETKKAACFKEIDAYYLGSIRHGKVRNGAVYMPPFEGILSQEAMWAIKTYLESRRANGDE